jgi:hypothetical protein
MPEQSSNGPEAIAAGRILPAACPISQCAGHMGLNAVMASLEGTGLEALVCSACGHRGFRAKDGVQILFGGRHEHVCSYGPSRLTITIVCSGAALGRFAEWGLSPSQVATAAASWARLMGQVAGTVHLLLESPAFLPCHDYMLRPVECGRLRQAHELNHRPAGDPSPVSDGSLPIQQARDGTST